MAANGKRSPPAGRSGSSAPAAVAAAPADALFAAANTNGAPPSRSRNRRNAAHAASGACADY